MSQLLIIDIQNNYKQHIGHYVINNLPEMASKFGTVYYLYDNINGEEFHDQLLEEWIDNESFINSLNIRSKNYGFFRDFMDTGIDIDEMVHLIKFMLEEKIYDIRDCQNSDNPELTQKFEEKFKNYEFFNLKFDSHSFWIPDDLVKFLQEDISDGVVLVGGGLEQCLREVELLLQALEIDYTIDHSFTY